VRDTAGAPCFDDSYPLAFFATCLAYNQQAKKRGLPILATTADVLPHTTAPKNVALFSSLGIFSQEEVCICVSSLLRCRVTDCCPSPFPMHDGLLARARRACVLI
jgi:hypothetical protein